MLKIYSRNFIPTTFAIFLLLNISVICRAQSSKLSFSFSETPLSAVIKEISVQFKVNILYNPGILPEDVKITGHYENISVTQALDLFLAHTGVGYRYFKRDIVLFKKNEEVVEKHSISKSEISKEQTPNRKIVTVTDTVTYSVITHDTVVTHRTEVVKQFVNDTVKIYDTVKVVQRVPQSLNLYKPRAKAFCGGISYSVGVLNSTFHVNNPLQDSIGKIKSALKAKSADAVTLSFLYKNKSWMLETGLSLSRLKFTLDYSGIVNEIVTRTDTIDRYYTEINGNDTTWVYVTQENQVEVSAIRNILTDLTYNYLSIPLYAGYSKVFKKAIFEVKAGVVFNYYLGSKGYYITGANDSTVQVKKSKAPGSTFSIDFYGAVAVDYFLGSNLHFYLQPYFRTSAVSTGYKKLEYYTTSYQVGLQAGIRYFF